MKIIKRIAILNCIFACSMHAVPIKNNNARIAKLQDDIAFWSNQQKEHAEFCVDFTTNEKMKTEGRAIAEKFNQLHKSPQGKKNEFLSLTSRIKKFQNNVKNLLSKDDKEFVIKNALIDHMNLEADYADKKVRGKRMTRKAELKFWMEEHKGEAEATAYYLRNDKELKKETSDLAEELKSELATPKLKLAEDANYELDEISDEIAQTPEKTRMPKKLAEHEQRERARARQTFKELSLAQDPIGA